MKGNKGIGGTGIRNEGIGGTGIWNEAIGERGYLLDKKDQLINC